MKQQNRIMLTVLLSAFTLINFVVYPARAENSQTQDKKNITRSTKYVMIVTGGELLSGIYPDGHTYFITRTLRPLGLECVSSISVDDKQADMIEALRYASNKAELVIITGGLGPTDNDITREALSEFTGITLKEHPDALKEMAQRFRSSPDRLRANLRRQTQAPTNGTYLKNSQGTAIGLVFEKDNSVIVALPGPPRELQAMVHNELVPYLSKRFGTRLPGCSLMLRFVGLGQSQIDQTLEDNVPLPTDITVSSQFEASRVDFTFTLPDDTPQDQARLQELKQKIIKHLGDNIYADDETSLEEHVLELLKARGETLALAEVGSGGSLTATLSNADKTKQILAGAFVAPTTDKLSHILGIKNNNLTTITQQLATAIAEATTSQWAIAIGDTDSSGYIEVAFRQPNGKLESRKVRLRANSELARSRLSTQLLDQLRRRLK